MAGDVIVESDLSVQCQQAWEMSGGAVHEGWLRIKAACRTMTGESQAVTHYTGHYFLLGCINTDKKTALCVEIK